MEFNGALDKILGQKTKVKILRYLTKNNTEQSGMRIAHETGINHWQTLKVMKDLYKQGMLKMHRAGNTYLFALRDDHYLVEELIIPLFKKESGSIEDMIKEVVKVCNKIRKNILISIILFGSISKRKEKAHSDIDVLVIVKDSKDKKLINDEMSKNNTRFLTYYGNTLSPYVVTMDEFIRRNKKGDKLIKNIIKTGRVIFGKTVGEMIIE